MLLDCLVWSDKPVGYTGNSTRQITRISVDLKLRFSMDQMKLRSVCCPTLLGILLLNEQCSYLTRLIPPGILTVAPHQTLHQAYAIRTVRTTEFLITCHTCIYMHMWRGWCFRCNQPIEQVANFPSARTFGYSSSPISFATSCHCSVQWLVEIFGGVIFGIFGLECLLESFY